MRRSTTGSSFLYLARELKFVEEDEETVPLNQIFLDGYICKPPVYRKDTSRKRDCGCAAWQSTVRMASRITYHASAGAEMRDMLRLSQ